MPPSSFFIDRADAGRHLAEKLSRSQRNDAVVLALPRGGVPVAFEIAKQLRLPLDLFVARKLATPTHPEFGFGAVAQGGIALLDARAIEMLGIDKETVDELVVQETNEVERRIQLYRGNRHNPQVSGKTLIVVDDGVATGVTALAAVRALAMGKPKRIILAIPVCDKMVLDRLTQDADEVVCLHVVPSLAAVSHYYEHFEQLTDDDVMELMMRAHRELSPHPPRK